MTGPEGLGAANAALAAVDNVSLVVGPAAAAGIVALGSSGAAFVVDGATFLVSAACRAAMRPVSVAPSRPFPALAGRRGLAVGVRAVTGSREVAIPVAAVALATLVYGIECVLLLVVAEDQLAMAASGVGVLYAAIGTGGLLATGLAARMAGRDGPGAALVVPVSLALGGATLVLLAATDSVVAACVLLAADGAANVVLEVAAVTSLQRRLTPELTARVTGVMNAVVAGAFLAGFGVAPVLISTAGVRGSMAAGGGLLALSAVVLHVRREGVPRAVRPASAGARPR